MFYFVYKTTCLVNQKIYIGVHKTLNLDDGYLGSGKFLKQAIKKYGYENFTREILSFHDSPESAFAQELLIVNENFIKDSSNYNWKIGGSGGDTLRQRCWANNGTQEKYFILSEIPDGWTRGRLKTNCVFSDPEKQKEFAKRVDYKKRAESLKQTWESGNFKRDNTKIAKYGNDNPSVKYKLTCPHCGKVVHRGVFTRCHGEKCKMKVNDE